MTLGTQHLADAEFDMQITINGLVLLKGFEPCLGMSDIALLRCAVLDVSI